MAGTNIKLETLRVKVWKLDKKADDLKKESELLKCQIAQLKSIENENSENGVEAVVDLNRILTRRGSNSKKLALAKALEKD